MNRAEAKRILVAFRPGTSDEEDPEVAQALDLMRGDPDLQDWLAGQRAFHDAVAHEFQSIPVPVGLKAAILRERIVIPFWRRPEFLMAAACLVLGLLLSMRWLGPPREDETFNGFRSRMVGFALREYRMDIVTNDPVQLRAYLKRKGAPADYAVPGTLRSAPAVGGARLSWQAQPVAMVCFGLRAKQILYMFVMDQTALKHGPIPGSVPERTQVRGIMTASWSRDGKVYLLAAADPDAVAGSAP